MLGGFEGDKIKNKNIIYNDQRKSGGWKNEGLPWPILSPLYEYHAPLLG